MTQDLCAVEPSCVQLAMLISTSSAQSGILQMKTLHLGNICVILRSRTAISDPPEVMYLSARDGN